jgi:hypothetical protein
VHTSFIRAISQLFEITFVFFKLVELAVLPEGWHEMQHIEARHAKYPEDGDGPEMPHGPASDGEAQDVEDKAKGRCAYGSADVFAVGAALRNHVVVWRLHMDSLLVYSDFVGKIRRYTHTYDCSKRSTDVVDALPVHIVDEREPKDEIEHHDEDNSDGYKPCVEEGAVHALIRHYDFNKVGAYERGVASNQPEYSFHFILYKGLLLVKVALFVILLHSHPLCTALFCPWSDAWHLCNVL